MIFMVIAASAFRIQTEQTIHFYYLKFGPNNEKSVQVEYTK